MSSFESSLFQNVPLAPPNAILGLALECRKDTFPDKIDMTIGAYRDDNGRPHVLNVVREAEDIIHNAKVDHEYLGQDGFPEFNVVAQKLLLGEDSPILTSGRLFTIQGISGTGSIRLGAEFIAKYLSNRTVYYPSVTWPGHPSILEESGCKAGTYRYLQASGIDLDFDGMIADLESFEAGSVVIFHNCAHNPSGIDPTEDQWRKILDISLRKNFLAFFDNAYQGFVSGDPQKDAFAVRLFAESGVELICAASFAKNFGLYGERTGALHFLAKDAAVIPNIASQLRVISRSLYSTCPTFGARIVALVLGDKNRKAAWERECAEMANRILSVREQLYKALTERNVKGKWEHVITQRGMFSYTGLTAETVHRLKNEYHIYLLSNGRVSLAGLNTKNIPRFVDALLEILGTN